MTHTHRLLTRELPVHTVVYTSFLLSAVKATHQLMPLVNAIKALLLHIYSTLNNADAVIESGVQLPVQLSVHLNLHPHDRMTDSLPLRPQLHYVIL